MTLKHQKTYKLQFKDKIKDGIGKASDALGSMVEQFLDDIKEGISDKDCVCPVIISEDQLRDPIHYAGKE